MLSRTVVRHRHDPRQRGQRRRWLALLALLLVSAYAAHRSWNAEPQMHLGEWSDQDLRRLVGNLALPPEVLAQKVVPDETMRLARLGQALFADPRLGAGGQRACASCHDPRQGFYPALDPTAGPGKDGSAPSAPDSAIRTLGAVPPLTGALLAARLSATRAWFGSDGRYDSLAAQAVGALADHRQMASSRLRAALVVQMHYAGPYQEAFGPLPAGLPGGEPRDAQPKPTEFRLPTPLAASALATLGGHSVLNELLDSAQKAHHAPVIELSHRASQVYEPPPAAWTQAWDSLPVASQEAVNAVTANTARAIAAYEQSLQILPSPFDRFAQLLGQGQAPAAAFDAGFGAEELKGLKLFAGRGQCMDCHGGPAFSDGEYHNVGAPSRHQAGGPIEFGRAAAIIQAQDDPFNCRGAWLAGVAAPAALEQGPPLPPCWALSSPMARPSPALLGAYRTPSLRGAASRRGFYHFGLASALLDAVEHNEDLPGNADTGQRDPALRSIGFTTRERQAIAAFITALRTPLVDAGAALAAKP